MNNILREIDSGNEVVLVMLDLSAAFDTIDHALLLERLQHRYAMVLCGLGMQQYAMHIATIQKTTLFELGVYFTAHYSNISKKNLKN